MSSVSALLTFPDHVAAGQNAETRAFYNVYQQDLRDENVEFAHLQREGEAMSYDDDMEDEQEMEVVTASEIHNKMRQMARGEVCRLLPFLWFYFSEECCRCMWISILEMCHGLSKNKLMTMTPLVSKRSRFQ